jgi:hypothetical protein
MSEWQPIETAPYDVEVRTKIHDEHGERNDQTLLRSGNLWWFPDKSMYVYYRPTHWMPLSPPLPRSAMGEAEYASGRT